MIRFGDVTYQIKGLLGDRNRSGKLVLLLFVSILNFVSLVEQPPNESEPRLCLLFVFVRHDCSTNC